MRSIAFINEKGGTGKTTLAVNLGAYLAMMEGKRVLLCDLDTQGHSSKALGLEVRGLTPTLFELLTDSRVSISSVLRQTAIPGLDLLPGNKGLARFPEEVAGAPDRARRLAARLRGFQDYDFLLFDSPPSMSLITINILLAAREIVIPVAMNYFSLDGCAEILETIERVRREHDHPGLHVSLVVPMLYRKTQLADEILEKLRERFPTQLSKTTVSYSVAIDEAQSHGLTIWEYAPQSRGGQLLAAVARELLAAS
jgi:chromosome partitioning protein